MATVLLFLCAYVLWLKRVLGIFFKRTVESVSTKLLTSLRSTMTEFIHRYERKKITQHIFLIPWEFVRKLRCKHPNTFRSFALRHEIDINLLVTLS